MRQDGSVNRPSEEKKGETMAEITTVGLDLAKNVFHLVGCNAHGKEVKRKMLKRGKLAAYVANLPPCLIGMEACAGAHDWARRFEELGHEIRLIAPQHVKAYVRGKTRTTTTMRGPSPRRCACRTCAS
jgi:transposase